MATAQTPRHQPGKLALTAFSNPPGNGLPRKLAKSSALAVTCVHAGQEAINQRTNVEQVSVAVDHDVAVVPIFDLTHVCVYACGMVR